MSRQTFNHEMLILARESRGLTQGKLAKMAGISQSLLSKCENGLLELSDQNLEQLSEVLKYPLSLFLKSDRRLGLGNAPLHHRKWQSISVRDLKRIQARVDLTRMHVSQLLRSAEIDSKYSFPRLDVADYNSVAEIASIVRRLWMLPLGPINDLTGAIERAGGIVVPCDFETRKLDAISQWLGPMQPLFFINTVMPWERIRFSLAHEIGHLVMHNNPSPDQEQEADVFAAAFLMPEHEIYSDLSNLTLERATHLKPYWRVSIQAIIRRAYDLGQITNSMYRRLFTHLSKLGYRRNEPCKLHPERPHTLQSLIDMHMGHFRYSKSDLSKLFDLYEGEFEAMYLARKSVGPITIVK